MDKTASLTPEVLNIVHDRGTESPNTGQYNNFSEKGTYLCRRCGLALFRSDHKFLSSCGWPSFDDELSNAIKRQADADGKRTEILCHRCEAHLGHVFLGEGATEKNLRHCVNSLALDFIPQTDVLDSEEAIYAAGCFWGVEHLFKQVEGVLSTEVGYSGGSLANPSYNDVCRGNTGHVEAVRVIYDPRKTNYKKITQAFFEIHTPTQTDGQGPDIGSQYLSVIFYFNQEQKEIAESLFKQLEDRGLKLATMIREVSIFWPAEVSHQNYYTKTGLAPYCHRREKRF